MFLGLLVAAAGAQAEEQSIPQAGKVVRAEALKPNKGPKGRPLPLVAHWHRRSLPLNLQLEMLEAGHYVLPWLPFDRQHGAHSDPAYAADVRRLRAWRLPFALITGGQWEASFYSDSEYLEAAAEQTGCGVSTETGRKIQAVSPVSPIKPWSALGHSWTHNEVVKTMVDLYPDVPLVLFVSNNEANDIRWTTIQQDKYFVDRYGLEKDDEFKRQVVGDGFIVRYRALIEGMRAGLTHDTWRKNSRFVAYNALGPDHFGRPMGSKPGWLAYATTTRNRIAWQPFAWEGAIAESYDNQWEPEKLNWRVWSCQVEMMNGVLLLEEAYKANPEFWHELIFWDGDLTDKGNDSKSKKHMYDKCGVPYTPDLYVGWVKHNLWVLTPRVAREWRGSIDDKDRWWPRFEKIVDAVDEIHNEPILSRFWRHGELVVNRNRKHPFDDQIPLKWQAVDRWYNLDTSHDPPGPWTLDTELPVMAVARVLGAKPSREWLVYAQATKENMEDVRIQIPGCGEIRTNPRLSGSYYHVTEADNAVTMVGR